MVDEVRKAATQDADYPDVVLVSLASVEANREFFAKRWPEARVVADPGKVVFDGFGRRRGGLLQLFGPAVMVRAIGALFRGHGVGRPQGDPTVMPGAFVVRGPDVLWAQDTKHVADHPDFVELGRRFSRTPSR
ncbi:MAG: AhpC/TSA family protein [Planctomycetota bacterium]|jgi:hypothetical protein